MRQTLLAMVLVGSATVAAVVPTTDQITVPAAVTYFTAKVGNASAAFCRLETAEIRYEFGGPQASSTVGFLWEPGEEKTIQNTPQIPNAVQTFNAIRTGATSGQLDCKYYGP